MPNPENTLGGLLKKVVGVTATAAEKLTSPSETAKEIKDQVQEFSDAAMQQVDKITGMERRIRRQFILQWTVIAVGLVIAFAIALLK